MKKSAWYNVIDFYRLTGIVLVWCAAWIFMMPHKADISLPYYDNAFGLFFTLFGITKTHTVNVSQLPDFTSSALALFVILILQVRGIFSLTTDVHSDSAKKHCPLFVCLNVLSIVVHTLYFSILIKIFLFPSSGATPSMALLKENLWLTVCAAVLIAGMVFGAQSLAKLFIILFIAVCIFHNASSVSATMGIWGFVGIALSAVGFYLEFCLNGFSKERLKIDLSFLLGRYDKISLTQKSVPVLPDTRTDPKGGSLLQKALDALPDTTV